MTESLSNPLLANQPLPKFSSIEPAHVVPAMDTMIAEVAATFEKLEKSAQASWDGLMAPLDRIDRSLNAVWGPIGHLNSVKNSPELRTAYEAVLPKLVQLSLQMAQSEKIYEKLCALRESSQWMSLDPARRRAVELSIRGAELSGIGLKGQKRERFNQVATRISELATKFQNNVLDATKAWSMVLTTADEIRGLPPSYLALASASYNRANADNPGTPENGPWKISLDMPSYLPFMEYAAQRDLREKVWRAHVTRASSGDIDNQPLILELLNLKNEEAKLLGFENWAERSLAEKMAESVPAVMALMNEVRTPSRKRAYLDLNELEALAKENGQTEKIEMWDTAYWRARLQEKQLEFNDEVLRPYFPLPHVMQGLFELIEKLFGIRLEPADGAAETWHGDVRFYHAINELDEHIASLYFDPFSRPENKNGGAWMNICTTRRKLDGEIETPVAYICCNFRPPVGDTPSLLEFGEVKTLFHEMGHALQHMLTRVEVGQVSGIHGVEWDAVELASQFMENWCYLDTTLQSISRHYKTGEPLPRVYADKLRRYRTFMSGLFMVRQLSLGEIDMELHTNFEANSSQALQDRYNQVVERNLVVLPPKEDRMLCGFSHIFAGGYSAGYYSYLWAEVLSADAFAAFEEAGLSNEEEMRRIGRRYRETVLALGGSRHPQDVFREFRGRSPTTTALLRHRGLVAGK
jgi:oligopeptidase A